MRNKAAGIIVSLFFVSQTSIFAAVEIYQIGEKYKDKQPVKVYVDGFTNESGKDLISPEAFKKVLETSLVNRKSMAFMIVQNPAESILRVSGIIKHYQYMNRGPFKVTPSVGGLLLETAATAAHNYVEMMVTFTVIDTKSGKIVWERTLSDYVKKDMTPEQSIPIIYDKTTRDFLSKCFGKPK
jgi:hypothetical protein